MGEEILTILESEGADLGRVLLCHLDNALAPDVEFQTAINYHEKLAKRGCFIGYDGCGKEHYFPSGSKASYPSFWCPSDRERARATARLVEAGFADRLLISHDICFKVELVKFGGFGYGHILRTFNRNMIEYGLAKEDIAQILVRNPQALFSSLD